MSRLSRRLEIASVLLASAVLVAAAVSGTLAEAKPATRLPGVTAMAGNFHIQDGWARINPVAGRPSSAYVTIHHGGTGADALIGASTPIAGRTEIHQHQMTGGVMRMVKIASIPIAADSETILQPGGYHLMLFDMKSLPKPGSRVPLQLTFKSGVTATLLITAQPITATGPAGASAAPMPGMDHAHHR